jgi:hypothetical protein
MKRSGMLIVAVLASALFAAGCQKKESTVDKAIDSTKDALDIREHEKLKDAGEDAKDAVHEAAEGVKDAAHDQ